MKSKLKQRYVATTILAAGIFGLAASPALAQRDPERNIYFGETHVHTSWSLDAFTIGNTLTTPGDANTDRFAVPPRVSFRHLYFSFDRGQGAMEEAAAARVKITGLLPAEAVATAAADRFMYRDYYGERTPEQVAKEFGPDFAKALFELRPNAWQGPIRSGYGWHLVLIDAIEPGRVPQFEEVESDVKSAWLDQRQLDLKEAAFKAMRARYTVVAPPLDTVDWASLRNSQIPIATEGLPQ